MSLVLKNIQLDEEEVVNSFLEWAKVNAPSGREKNIAEMLENELTGMGFFIQFDEANVNFKGEIGNLIAYWEGTDSSIPPLFFSTHMDTVLPTEGLKPVIKDGVIYSDGTTILGADDRAALTAYLEAIRYVQENDIPSGPIELILTVNEQQALQGSRYLDYSKVKSDFGYVFDSSGDVGQIILQGPYSSKFHLEVIGKSSHIGLNPEEGIYAFEIAADIIKNVKVGKIDEETLVNVGLIHGGELSSIIPGSVKMTGEVRCFNKAGLDEQLDLIFSAASRAAEEHGGKVVNKIDKKYSGFQVDKGHQLAKIALDAAEQIQVHPWLTRTLGGADTNNLNENNLTCITLGNGFRNIHTFQEHISIKNLVNTARYTVSLIQSWYNLHKND
ncbi:M20/M25/M40 family metallo-hydrolase [Siminovitchia acidinfaciens]|uniref:M20/M25/M40 family metallo-hydrolase n=1 Tax=Siminovitchia acidinfaciens TaxID=2321395 RepID=A0A429Y6S7_9BACI|nr:M20/M25/M40 family metallo-hydrolase [Siminovitchia acidinfaciens]RST77140.1 M20/M25/M40 family metallo-hydrolase [Siminovitchia acidinfaciens]